MFSSAGQVLWGKTHSPQGIVEKVINRQKKTFLLRHPLIFQGFRVMMAQSKNPEMGFSTARLSTACGQEMLRRFFLPLFKRRKGVYDPCKNGAFEAEDEAHGHGRTLGKSMYAAQGGNERDFLQHLDSVFLEAAGAGGRLHGAVYLCGIHEVHDFQPLCHADYQRAQRSGGSPYAGGDPHPCGGGQAPVQGGAGGSRGLCVHVAEPEVYLRYLCGGQRQPLRPCRVAGSGRIARRGL